MSKVKTTVYHKPSERRNWGTPKKFMEFLESKFQWKPALDCCAEPDTAKAEWFFTKEDDALSLDWLNDDLSPSHVWLNPPYGSDLPLFLDYANSQYIHGNAKTIFCLVPSRTDTQWAHRAIKNCQSVYFIEGRLNFTHQDAIKTSNASAPFPSMLLIWGYPKIVGSLEKMQLLHVPRENRGWGA